MHIVHFQPHSDAHLLTTIFQKIENADFLAIEHLLERRGGNTHAATKPDRFKLAARDEAPNGPLRYPQLGSDLVYSQE